VCDLVNKCSILIGVFGKGKPVNSCLMVCVLGGELCVVFYAIGN